MVLEYLKLFVTFAKIGMFTIGGGYAMIPLIEREIVNKQWMNKEEFMKLSKIEKIRAIKDILLGKIKWKEEEK